MKSVFTEKTKVPNDSDLKEALGKTYEIWQQIEQYTLALNPDLSTEWKYSGEKFGRGYRINDKKRVVVYLLPREGFFKVAFVFGQKATDAILESTIKQQIKEELANAKAYAEGRGIRIEIKDYLLIEDIKKLIDVKTSS